MGGNTPVLVQSMTNTPTCNVDATVAQVKQLAASGCDIVRITVPGLNEVECFKHIVNKLRNLKIYIPIVADVHFSPKVAEKVAPYADKIRINPGNYLTDKTKQHFTEKDFVDSSHQIAENILPLINLCKKHQTAIRIGVNLGSLSKRILYRYGNTAKGMVESALEFTGILLEAGFYQFTLSLKASNVRIMQEANIMLVKEMIKKNIFFPLHLGVTEAGAGNDARIKSAAGIGTLLQLGIGNTIRVSLTEAPETEIPVAKKLLKFVNSSGVSISELNKLYFHPIPLQSDLSKLISRNGALVVTATFNKKADLYIKKNRFYSVEDNHEIGDKNLLVSTIKSNETDFETFLLDTAVAFANNFLTKCSRAIYLVNPHFNQKTLLKISFDVLQALGLRYSKTEYIACPSCGRTRFNIMEQLKRVKEKTAQFKGIKIAVMGCIVNGPGEMIDADYGFVGSGKGKITLYKAGKIVAKHIPENEAVDALLKLIKSSN